MDVILDVDTGVDDALALLFAIRHPELRIRAITCVTGNVGVDQVVINTLKVLDAAGAPADLPIAAGAQRPLVAPADLTRSAHGLDGLADLGLSGSTRRPVLDHAVELLHQVLMAATEPVTLVSLAPLTNIALLLRMYPAATDGIRRLVCVGGSARQADTSSDFNLRSDPEAAAIVLSSGLPITMYGSDVFYQVTVGRTDAAGLAVSADPGARLAGLLAAHQLSRFGTDDAPLGDAGAVISLVEPRGLGTVWDADRVEVAVTVDSARYRELFLASLSEPSRPG